VTCAVTGACGFIGSRLVAALNARGIDDIVAVDNLPAAGELRNLADKRVRDYLRRDQFLERYDGRLQAVFHQGACTDTMEYDRGVMMQANLEYSRRLLEKCQARRVPLIYASSASVYGAGPEFREHPACERPLNVYGESKLLFDRLVRERLPQAAAQIAGLRYFNVYGPGEAHKGRMASVAFHAWRQLRETGKVRLFVGSGGYGDGEQRRDFVYVDDVCAVNLWFFEHPERSGIYNCGTGRAQTFNELAAAMIGAAGEGSIEYVPFPPGLLQRYQSYTQADLAQLRAAGYPGEFRPVERGIADYVEHLKAA
jgi:ADP-L-glycero-D-manno-heptose 6-epimerase